VSDYGALQETNRSLDDSKEHVSRASGYFAGPGKIRSPVIALNRISIEPAFKDLQKQEASIEFLFTKCRKK
jgi:hypothetical protein